MLRPSRHALARLVIVAAVVTGSSEWAVAAQGEMRLVAASNVRLRASPSEEVTIVTTVPLGTSVTELEISRDRQWVRVRTSDGQEGWMRDGFSRRVPAGEFVQVAQDIIRRRLDRTGDGFAAWIDLEAFIDRVRKDLPVDREFEARFALYRLQTIAKTAIAGERYNRPVAPAFAEWLDTHAATIVRHEPAGQWILRRDVILAEHDRFKTERAGDLIAWFAVTNGLPGECEGFVLCYLTWDNLLWAEYLRRMPSGIFVDSALRTLRERVTHYREDLVPMRDLLDPVKDCTEFAAAVGRIREATAAVDVSRRGIIVNRDRTLAAIDALRTSVCQPPGRAVSVQADAGVR